MGRMKKLILIASLLLPISNGWGEANENYTFSDYTKEILNKGDWILRSGYTFLVPQFGKESQVEMGRYSMPTLSFSYLVTDNLGIEFLTGIPSEINIYSKTMGTEAKLASFISLSPNATLQYYFNPKNASFRPYIGSGLIYSSFHKEKAHGILSGANFRLKKSLDPLYQIGFDYVINNKISLNLDIRKLKTSSGAIATDLDKTIMGSNAPPQIEYGMDMQPITVSLNFAWLFDNPKKTRERRIIDKEDRVLQKRQKRKTQAIKRNI